MAPPGQERIPDLLAEILERALGRYPLIKEVVVVSGDGFAIAHFSKKEDRSSTLSAYAPLLHDAGMTVFKKLSMSSLSDVMLVGPEGVVYIVRFKSMDGYVLLWAAGEETNLGLLRVIASEIESEADTVLEPLRTE